jgi:predicted nucleotidyltransferase
MQKISTKKQLIPMQQYAASQGTIEKKVVEALQTALGTNLLSIVLFGSQARGEARMGSDWDFLIIAEGLPKKAFERHLFLKQLAPNDCRGEVSFVAKTPEEFEAYLSSLYLDIALDGKILYDPKGYAFQRLTLLRQLIKRKGLVREKSGKEMCWQWTREPTQPWALEWEA